MLAVMRVLRQQRPCGVVRCIAALLLCAMGAIPCGCRSSPSVSSANSEAIADMRDRLATLEKRLEDALEEASQETSNQRVRVDEGAIIDELWHRGRDAGILGPPGPPGPRGESGVRGPE